MRNVPYGVFMFPVFMAGSKCDILNVFIFNLGSLQTWNNDKLSLPPWRIAVYQSRIIFLVISPSDISIKEAVNDGL